MMSDDRQTESTCQLCLNSRELGCGVMGGRGSGTMRTTTPNPPTEGGNRCPDINNVDP